MRRLIVFIWTMVLTTLSGLAQQRVVRTINDGWTFTKDGVSETVSIPHTWNAHDTWDDVPGFYRGLCTYENTIHVNDDISGRKVYLRFEGASQETEAFVNGKPVGSHVGSYTAFMFDITDVVKQGSNTILVHVDNKYNPDIAPLSADYTFYGGIYRDVELVITPANHIRNDYYASNGVFISTPVVGENSTVCVKTLLDVAPGKYVVAQDIYDPSGKLVASSQQKLKKAVAECIQNVEVSGCKLWDVDSPNVYRVITTLKDAKGVVLDSVENPLGFRTYSFDAENGFTLNGRSLKLMGTNRHQDYLDMGNALPDEMHVRDVNLLREMGGNFLRIAHYPQDPIVAQLCDRYGIVASVEIPVINAVTLSEAFKRNCVEMAREMVCQNYNNPSVIIWAYMNEVMLEPPHGRGNVSQEYMDFAYEVTLAVDQAIRELDPSRPTMLPMDTGNSLYARARLVEIPDILGYNHYQGWYSWVFSDFEDMVAKEHGQCPDKPLIITEYGAGVDPRLHSRKPARFDFSMEYGTEFHKHYIDVIKNTPYIAGSNVWNLNDFYSEGRKDAVPHVNNKGIVGLDRKVKDSYLLYQANLLREPFVALAGRNWVLRGGLEGEVFTQEVYTNLPQVSLWLNGKSVGTTAAKNGVAVFEVAPADGWNLVSARAEGVEDAVRFQYKAVPSDMAEFSELSVSLGSDCEFEDDVHGLAWIPEKEYAAGGWGYVGGDKFYLKTAWNGNIIGTNADIHGTTDDPLFQTQRIGIDAFKADVPDGQYYVYLYFAELAIDSTGKAIPYSLGNDVIAAGATKRVFDVSINGNIVLKDFDVRSEFGETTAVMRKFTVNVAGGEGLTVGFDTAEGEPILNAIRIYRCF